MVYPLGVSTATEIVTTSYKLFKLYEEARGRQAKVHAANELLSSIGFAIDKLEQAGGDEGVSNNGSALAQVRTARTAWAGLDKYLQKFAVNEQKQSSLVPRARSVYDDLRWAINILDGKVWELKQEISLSLLAVVPTQMAELQSSMALLTTTVRELRSAATLQTITDKSLIVRTSVDHAFSRDLSAADVRSPAPLETDLANACWTRSGGCHCRCHSKTSTKPNNSRYMCVETQGWQAFGKTCNVEKCNARFICVRLRLAVSRALMPWAITIALRLDATSAIPRISFTPSRVCNYTSRGFVALAELQLEFGMAFVQKVASFKLLFSSGQASHTDVRPDGKGYLDLILRGPWPPGMREAQWDLVKFLIVGAPASVLRNPRLLHHCASWIGEGPHMDMLATLFSFGLDPEHLDSSLFFVWPRSCDPGWLAEDLILDPMFIDFFRACLRRQPGFAGCDDLTEAVLTGDDSEFESALRYARGDGGILRMQPNALGQTATHLAITSPRRLQRILAAGADSDCVDRGGLTPLMYAAAYGEQQSVLHLIEHHATWHLQERLYGRNFLDFAICRRNLHVIESLIHWLSKAGDYEGAFEVLDHCIAYCILQHHDHYDITIPRRLFELGADADAISNGGTLLHFARTSVISQLIVNAGFTSFHIRDDSGKTPLMQVASLVDAKSLVTVASHGQGADFYARDAKGRTVLHHLLGSRHINQIYHHHEADTSWQLAQHQDIISCLNTLLRHGASASNADSCICACSAQGCTALTFALDQLSRSFCSASIDCGVVIDLLQTIRHQSDPEDVSTWPAAITRYYEFEEKRLTHTCCLGRDKDPTSLDYRLGSGTFASARAEQTQAMANSTSEFKENKCIDDEIMSSLATLCFLYESQSFARSKTAVARRERKIDQSSSLLQVDYAKDEIKYRFGFGTTPRIREITMDRYRHWLRWCDRNFVKLDIKGGRRNYTEYGWHLVSMFEDKVDELRSGTQPWYTAPEQPMETQ